MPEGRQRMEHPEYQRDYEWAPDGGNAQPDSTNDANIGQPVGDNGGQEQPLPSNEHHQQLHIEEEVDLQSSKIGSTTSRQKQRKRDEKYNDKVQKQLDRIEMKSGPRTSIGGATNLSTVFDTRISQIELENDGLRREVTECKTSYNNLLKIFNEQQTQLGQMQQLLNSLVSGQPLTSHMNTKVYKDSSVTIKNDQQKQSPISADTQREKPKYEEVKIRGQNEVSTEVGKAQDTNDLEMDWRTWISVASNDSVIAISGDSSCKVQGMVRSHTIKNGVGFLDIVKKLHQVLKLNLGSDGYKKEVSKLIRGSKLRLGFAIQEVIGVGNLGTTVLAKDMQMDCNVILKVYHAKLAMQRAINEFNMLHKASNCKHIVKPYSLMYNTSGSYLALAMEDLSSLSTLYNYCGSDHEQNERLLTAKNCCIAVAELHQLNIVHGDLASENLLINPITSEVIIIDFDLSSMEGTSMYAGGNLDFVSNHVANLINANKKMKSSKQNDIYSLAICCYLLIGDQDKIYYESLSADESIDVKVREEMIKNESYVGDTIVVSLLKNQMTAANAAIALNELYCKL